MLFSKSDNSKQKKKALAPSIFVLGLASVGAYAIVSCTKKKLCSLACGMKKFFSGKEKTPCPCTAEGDGAPEHADKSE